MHKSIIAVTAAAFVALSSGAFAQQQNIKIGDDSYHQSQGHQKKKQKNVEVNGTLLNTGVNQGNVATIATGHGSEAETQIGVATDVKINGTAVNTGVNQGNIATIADGDGSYAKTKLGTLEDVKVNGYLENVGVNQGNIANVAKGDGTTACVEVGSVGSSDDC